MPRSGDEAKTRILDAAERLFAERGVESVSLRDVAAAAGQRNNSATQYHFGDRAGLVAAVFARRMQRVGERRALLAHQIERAGDERDITALVLALVGPLAEVVCETGGWCARFLVRIYWDGFAMRAVGELPQAAFVEPISTHLHAALSDLDGAVRASRINQLAMLLVTTLASWEWAHDRGEPRLPVGVLADEIVATGVALLRAPTVGSRPDGALQEVT